MSFGGIGHAKGPDALMKQVRKDRARHDDVVDTLFTDHEITVEDVATLLRDSFQATKVEPISLYGAGRPSSSALFSSELLDETWYSTRVDNAPDPAQAADELLAYEDYDHTIKTVTAWFQMTGNGLEYRAYLDPDVKRSRFEPTYFMMTHCVGIIDPVHAADEAEAEAYITNFLETVADRT